MPTATHALWALQTMGYEEEVADLAHLFEKDYSWWAMIYSPAFNLLPKRFSRLIEDNIRSLLPVMSQPYALHEVNHFDEN